MRANNEMGPNGAFQFSKLDRERDSEVDGGHLKSRTARSKARKRRNYPKARKLICTRSDFRASASANQSLLHHYVQTYCSMMDSVTIDKLDLDINVVANLFLVGNENHPTCYSVNVLAYRFFVLRMYRFSLLFNCFHSVQPAKAAPNSKSLTLTQPPQVPDPYCDRYKQW